MNQPARVDDPALTRLTAHAIAGPLPIDLACDDDVSAFPAGHPAWQRDALSVSSRVRALLVTLHPLALRVLTFWDHAVRAVRIGNRALEVDPSGCYRLR